MNVRWCVLALLTLSCSRSSEEPRILDEEEFVNAYVALLDSASTVTTERPDSTLSPVAQRILERQNIRADEFKATVNEYNKNVKRWEAFYAEVVRRIRVRDSLEATETATPREPLR